MTGRAGLIAALIVIGTGWGITLPLMKIAVSSGHGAFGLIFWQQVVMVLGLGALMLATGRRLPRDPASLRAYLLIAIIGTVLPNSASYRAAVHLPAGVLSILLSLIPMLAFPFALAMGVERFRPVRLLGLVAGLGAVLLLVLPEASLPDRSMVPWVGVALLAGIAYAFEGNFVARYGTGQADAIQTIFGASLAGAVMVWPLMVGTGQGIDPRNGVGLAEAALVGSALIHAAVYVGYVWLVGRAGSVFAVQCSYIVTISGVFWAMVLLGESYSPYIWASLGLMLAGLALVQPRDIAVLAAPKAIGQTGVGRGAEVFDPGRRA
jgi:drug/metabolite transporter (DMT)-like permease